MVPLLMAPCAPDLARRAALHQGRDVLELAAGTGVLSRQLVQRLAPTTSLTVTDLNPPMLAVAERLLPAGRATVQVADVNALPFDDESFDLVVSQFGIMFVPDKIVAAREARRVLRPGGTFLFNTWQSLDVNPIAQAPNEAIKQLYPENPPGFLSVPFSYFDPRQIERDMQRAGFAKVEIEPVEIMSTLESPERAATAFLEGTPLFHEQIEKRGPGLDEVRAILSSAITHVIGGPGAALPLRILVVTAQ